jgi:tRNA-splicing ligase RtcB
MGRRRDRPPRRPGSRSGSTSARGESVPRRLPIRLERVDEVRWRIPRDAGRGMRVDGLVLADDTLMAGLRDDPALVQVGNVATLPGIVGASLGMPDIHWGYGFPVGGVAAFRLDGGVVSPGGIGFDIDCGVRLLRSDLGEKDVRPHLGRLADALFVAVPSGVGAHLGRKLGSRELDEVLVGGAGWAVDGGHGTAADLDRTEERGRLAGADPDRVSPRAKQRGADQLGTLGSGNHFLEIQVVDRIDDATAAEVFGLALGQIAVMVHCGSRGLGHQVCTDHVATMDRALPRYGIELPDRQLACAPLGAPEADAYLGAMAAAANFAWANRQLIADAIRRSFAHVLGRPWQELGLHQVYDLSHNIAKVETHVVGGHEERVCVHRKGATRAFPAGHPDVPAPYRAVGQPVLIPGDMGRHSFVCVGAAGSMTEAFGSACHGAGRNLSRHAAIRALAGVDVAAELGSRGILVRAERRDLLAEEASLAYKDVEAVVATAERAGLVRSVARMRPLAVIKG